jgi:hypothetical protein
MEWNKEDIYDEKIAPLMAEILKICKENELPIVCTIQYGCDEEDRALFCTSTICNQSHADKKMLRLAEAHKPERAVNFAETYTKPDGTKEVRIQRIT